MSKWNALEWEGLLNGSACPICRDGKPYGIVAELPTSYLTSSPHGATRGNCTLFLKRHAVELYELSADEAFAFMRDLQSAAEVIQRITGAVKMNYEIHGNTIPHLHLHLYPRFRGDPFENGPINPRLVQESPYEAGEFEAFVQKLQAGLK
jgi:diadenosine tetraphosphate (Ap4A) HIT family hydrolase